MEKRVPALRALESGMDNNNSDTPHMYNEALQMRSAAQINASWNDVIHSGHETNKSRNDSMISPKQKN